MAEFKLVIGTKDGKSFQKEIKDEAASSFLTKKIGDKIKGESIDLPGYEFEITGGSDYCGFPMRADVTGIGRKRVLAVKGVGIKNKKKYRKREKKGKRTMKGMRQRRTVAGNTIYSKTAQINLKVIKAGKAPLVAAPAEKKEEAPKEGKKEAVKEEKPKKEKKEEAKEEKKEEVKEEKQEKKEETPKEEKKEEPKPEKAPKEEKPAEEKKEEKKE
jgi:small subunit ribosomal protein S6e